MFLLLFSFFRSQLFVRTFFELSFFWDSFRTFLFNASCLAGAASFCSFLGGFYCEFLILCILITGKAREMLINYFSIFWLLFSNFLIQKFSVKKTKVLSINLPMLELQSSLQRAFSYSSISLPKVHNLAKINLAKCSTTKK